MIDEETRNSILRTQAEVLKLKEMVVGIEKLVMLLAAHAGVELSYINAITGHVAGENSPK